jgi:hypothetical protein
VVLSVVTREVGKGFQWRVTGCVSWSDDDDDSDDSIPDVEVWLPSQSMTDDQKTDRIADCLLDRHFAGVFLITA